MLPMFITSFTLTTTPLFFFNDTATTEIYTLSLHDALPISRLRRCDAPRRPEFQLPDGGNRRLVIPGFFEDVGYDRVGRRIAHRGKPRAHYVGAAKLDALLPAPRCQHPRRHEREVAGRHGGAVYARQTARQHVREFSGRDDLARVRRE